MLRSMTAYVHKILITPYGRLTIEMQSLNKKHFELQTFLGNEFSHYEVDIRKVVANEIQRGKINLKISLIPSENTSISVRPNIPLLRALKKAWNEIQSELGVSTEKSFDISLLKDQEGLLIYEDLMVNDTDFKNDLFDHLKVVLHSFMKMKLNEGAFLYKDIVCRLNLIESYLEQIRIKAPNDVEVYKKKICDKLELLLPANLQNDDRVLREVCFFADRVDITEEIIRLQSHISQFKKNIDAAHVSIGKKLEFLMVEMGREVNTIASKTTNTEISHYVVDIKAEIEKIKEQLQNIE